MSNEKDIGIEIQRFKEIAALEDRLDQAQVELAAKFDLIARTFAAANPDTICICEDYIGSKSSLLFNARYSVVRIMTDFRQELDELQRIKSPCLLNEEPSPDWFSYSHPLQTFLGAELVRRNLNIPMN